MPSLNRLNKAFDARPKRRTLTVVVADLTASAVSQSFDIGAAMPAGAIIMGTWVDVATTFTGGGASTTTVDVGVKAGTLDLLINGGDVFTATGRISTPIGAQPCGHYGAFTPTIKVISDVNVDTLTTGSLEVEIIYMDGDNTDVAG